MGCPFPLSDEVANSVYVAGLTVVVLAASILDGTHASSNKHITHLSHLDVQPNPITSTCYCAFFLTWCVRFHQLQSSRVCCLWGTLCQWLSVWHIDIDIALVFTCYRGCRRPPRSPLKWMIALCCYSDLGSIHFSNKHKLYHKRLIDSLTIFLVSFRD